MAAFSFLRAVPAKADNSASSDIIYVMRRRDVMNMQRKQAAAAGW